MSISCFFTSLLKQAMLVFSLFGILSCPSVIVYGNDNLEGSSNSSSVTATKGKMQNLQGFDFELLGCKGEGTIECTLLVSSSEGDKNLVLIKHYDDTYTRLISNAGIEHQVTDISVGVGVGRTAYRNKDGLENHFIEGVPLRMVLRFKNVDPSVKKLALLDVIFQVDWEHSELFRVGFRNVLLKN